MKSLRSVAVWCAWVVVLGCGDAGQRERAEAAGAGPGAEPSLDVPAPSAEQGEPGQQMGADAGGDAGEPAPACQPGPCQCDDPRGSGSGSGSCDAQGELVCDCSAVVPCAPGEVVACECEQGGAGTARCSDAGDRIDTCVCEAHFVDSGYRLPPEIGCIVERQCSTCHGAMPEQEAPMSLVSWEDFHAPTPSQPEVPVYLWVGDRAGRDDALRMPPPGSRALSGRDQDAIVAWALAGAPPAPAPQPPPMGPSREGIPPQVVAVLQANCYQCHGPQPIGGAIRLTAIEDWFQMSPLYDPTRRVWQVARERIELGEMPQGRALDPVSMSILIAWFDAEPQDCSPLP